MKSHGNHRMCFQTTSRKFAETKSMYVNMAQPFNGQCLSHIETSQLICYANQFTGFYIRRTLVVEGLTSVFCFLKLERLYDRKNKEILEILFTLI